MKKLRSLLILSILCGAVSAQVPQGFNYQAVARDGTGALLGNTTLQVMLYIQSSPTGGTIFWKELHNPVTTNPFGLFTVVLGTGVRQTGSTAATFDKVDWTVIPKYIKTEIFYSGLWRDMGNAAQLWTVPYAMTAKTIGAGKLNIKGTETDADSALFEVKRSDGKTVFAVYNEGVRVFVADGYKGSGTRGGFAVGGFDATKASQQYLVVTADSTRIYTNNAAEGKGTRGGFAVGGFDATKATPTLFTSLTRQNYFIGHTSGIRTDPRLGGLYNTFLGYESGFNNTSGTRNIFIGYRTGYSNDTGFNNVFIGNEAGLSNSSGFFNIFIGEGAGVSNTTAARNVFLGQLAGRYNTTGQANVFIGQQSGEANTTGSFNLFAGRNAGNFNTTGQLNTFLGINAGNANTIGNENVNLGGESGKWNSTGSYNVNLGTGAGFSNTDGNYNINIGHFAGVSLTSGSGNIFIGAGAGGGLAGTSNKLFIENSYADANNALIYGEFDNNRLRFNANVGVNTNPDYAKLSVVDDVTTMAVRGETSWSGSTAHYGVFGYGAGSTGFNHGVFGSASGGSQAFGVWGTGSGASDWTIGVFGTTTSGTGRYAVYASGDLAYTGGIFAVSDKNFKRNIAPITGALGKILKLNGISYQFKSENELSSFAKTTVGNKGDGAPSVYNFPEGMQIGVIAQDVETVLPELVKTNPDGYKMVDYVKLIPVLVEAMKEQQKMIDDLKAEIDALKKK